jgi:sensor histidine kinase YesM
LWSEAVPVTFALWLFILVIYAPMIIDRHSGGDFGSILLDCSTIFVSIVIAMPIFAAFKATLDWQQSRRALILALCVLSGAIIQTLFDFMFTGWIAQNYAHSWAALPRDLTRGYGKVINYACVFAVNVALFNLLVARHRQLRQERTIADARTTAQQAQLAALRYQLNPHFLFNTLNAISAMIVTRRNEDAEEMTNRLSSFLRGSLQSDPGALIPLESELSLIEEYLEIESIRFGDRLKVVFDCSSEACAAMVPGFILQPLVENAIKYAVAPSPDPVTLRIMGKVEAGMLIVAVEDDGAFDHEIPDTTGVGVGLRNIRDRLAALHGSAAALKTHAGETGFRATIEIPY